MTPNRAVLIAMMIGGLSQPAGADDNVAIIATGQVTPLCSFAGQVFPTAGVSTAGETIAPGETATSIIDLSDSRDQSIGTYRFLCNTPSAAVTISSLNDFRLLNPAGGPNGRIPYLLKIPGLAQLSSGITATTAYQETTGPDRANVERQLLVDVGTLNLFNLPPGAYTDQLVVTLQPSP